MRVNLQELDQMLAQPVVVGMLHHRLPLARPREWHLENVAHLARRPVGHHHSQAVVFSAQVWIRRYNDSVVREDWQPYNYNNRNKTP